MFKKTLFLSLPLITSLSQAGTMPVVYPEYNTISYTTSKTTTLQSNQATVAIIVYTTALPDSKQTVQDAAIQVLKNILPKANWKMTHIEQQQSQSGALNITLTITTRLNTSEITIKCTTLGLLCT